MSITYVDTDIASKMLSALILESDDSGGDVSPQVSMDEQKRYLKKYTDTVTVNDRKELGNILVRNNNRAALHPCSEGTVINLDALSAPEVEQMYNLLVFKKEQPVQR